MLLVHCGRTGGTGKKTATAATAITSLIRARRGLRGLLSKFAYTPGATSHTLTAMMPLAVQTAAVASAAAQAVITLPADPGTTASGVIAANDFLVFEVNDGQQTQQVGIVSSVGAANADGSVPVTLAANIATGGVAAGAKVWYMGAPGDGHAQYDLATGAQRTISDPEAGAITTEGMFQPILLHVNNITNAGVQDYASWGWVADIGLTGPAAAPAGAQGAPAAADEDLCGPCVVGATPHAVSPETLNGFLEANAKKHKAAWPPKF